MGGSSTAVAAVRRRFCSAALAGTRAKPYGATDPYRPSRSPVRVSGGIRWFGHRVAGGMRLADDLRTVHDRRRYTDRIT